MPTVTIPADTWKMPLDRIKKQRCALILGPDLATSASGLTHREALIDYFRKNSAVKAQLTGEELFPFSGAQPVQRLDALIDVQNFFQSLPYDDLFSKLGEIPFHLIISLSPDPLMYQGLEKSGRNFQHGFYRKGMNPPEIQQAPTSDQPLLYQLLGKHDDEDSLILTYGDLFQYIQGIFGNYSLPERLRESVNRCNYFIFLGVQYEKWYLKLLLQLLDLQEQEKVIDACHSQNLTGPDLEGFYSNYLSVQFVNYDVRSYVEDLYQAWSSSLEKSEGKNEGGAEDKVGGLMRSGSFGPAFELLSRMPEEQRQPFLCKPWAGSESRNWVVLTEKLLEESSLPHALEVLSWVVTDEMDRNDVISLKMTLSGLTNTEDEYSPEDFQRQMVRLNKRILTALTTIKDNSPCD